MTYNDSDEDLLSGIEQYVRDATPDDLPPSDHPSVDVTLPPATPKTGKTPALAKPATATPVDYEAKAREYATKYGLDPDVYVKQIRQESGFNPRARSPKGALGMAQFMPATGRRYGLRNVKDFFDPDKSLDAGARYRAFLRDRYKDQPNGEQLASAAYNAGEGAVDDYLHGTNFSGKNPRRRKTADGIPPFRETRDYVKSIHGAPDDFLKGIERYVSDAPAGAPAQVVPDAQLNTGDDDLLSGIEKYVKDATPATTAPANVPTTPSMFDLTPQQVSPQGAFDKALAMAPDATQPHDFEGTIGNQQPAFTNQGVGDEFAFRKWYAERAKRLNLDPNPDDPRHRYDYRAAFRAGAEPDPVTKHWPSEFKAPDHPNRFVVENGQRIDTITGKPAPLPPPSPYPQRERGKVAPVTRQPVLQPKPPAGSAAPAGSPDTSSVTSSVGLENAQAVDEGEEATYAKWYEARRLGNTAEQHRLGQDYLTRFGKTDSYYAGKRLQAVRDYAPRMITTPDAEKQGAFASVEIGDVLRMRDRGVSDDVILRRLQDAAAERIGLSPTDVAVFMNRTGEHPMGTEFLAGTGAKYGNVRSQVDGIIAQAQSALSPEEKRRGLGSADFTIPPAMVSRIREILPLARPQEEMAKAAALGSDRMRPSYFQTEEERTYFDPSDEEKDPKKRRRLLRPEYLQYLSEIDPNEAKSLLRQKVYKGGQVSEAEAKAAGLERGYVDDGSTTGRLLGIVNPGVALLDRLNLTAISDRTASGIMGTVAPAVTFLAALGNSDRIENISRQASKAARGEAELTSDGSTWTSKTIEGAASSVPFLATPGGKLGASVVGSLTSAGQAYEEMREMGMSREEAKKLALLFIPPGALEGMFGVNQATLMRNFRREAMEVTLRQYLKKLGVEIAKGAAEESLLEEIPQGIMTRWIKKGVYDPNTKVFDWQAMKEEGIVAGVVGGVFGGASHAKDIAPVITHRGDLAALKQMDAEFRLRDLKGEPIEDADFNRYAETAARVAARERGQEEPDATLREKVRAQAETLLGRQMPSVVPQGGVAPETTGATPVPETATLATSEVTTPPVATDITGGEPDARQEQQIQPETGQAGEAYSPVGDKGGQVAAGSEVNRVRDSQQAEVTGQQEEVVTTPRTYAALFDRIGNDPQSLEAFSRARNADPVFQQAVRDYLDGRISNDQYQEADLEFTGRYVDGLSGQGAAVNAAPAVNERGAKIVSETPATVPTTKKILNERRTAQREADTDPLTGVANRRALDRALPAAEADPNTAVVSFDANNFGQVNKIKGEVAGDEMLKEITAAVSQAAGEVNPKARVFRRGGDEIVVLANKNVAEQVRTRAEEIFGERRVEGGGKTVQVSLSGSVGDTFETANAPLQTAKAERKAALAKTAEGARQAAQDVSEQRKGQRATKIAKGKARAEAAETPAPEAVQPDIKQAASDAKTRIAEAIAKGVQANIEASGTQVKPTARTPKRVTIPDEVKGQYDAAVAKVKAEARKLKDTGLAHLAPKGWGGVDTGVPDLAATERVTHQWHEKSNRLVLNAAGILALRQARGKGSATGLTVSAGEARRMAKRAMDMSRDANADLGDLERSNLVRLAAALTTSAGKAEEFAITLPGLSQRGVIRHEKAHEAQLALERFFQVSPRAVDMLELPHYDKIEKGLSFRGYTDMFADPRLVAYEGFAHIAGGQRDLLRLTEDEADDFAEGYFRLIAKTYGKSDVLNRFDKLSGGLRRVRDAIREEIRTAEGQRSATAARPERSGSPGAGVQQARQGGNETNAQAGGVQLSQAESFAQNVPLETSPLPESFVAAIRELSRSFFAGGNTDYAAMVDEIADIIDDNEVFARIADYIPDIVIGEHRAFLNEQARAGEFGRVDKPNTPAIAAEVRAHFLAGDGFDSITDARAFVGDLMGVQVKPGTALAKAVDEAVELGVVLAARQIVTENRGNPAQTYDRLVKLYDRQPTLGTRTSTSVQNQAYSTPVPIAYVASQLTGITDKTTVYEPTAGNGALLIEATAGKVIANELNTDRYDNLQATLKGAAIRGFDASESAPSTKVDAVIANPPFGAVKDDSGKSRTFRVNDRYSTNEIDHAIALKALEAMKDNGRATLIVGGVNSTDEAARSDGYNGKAKRAFYKTLYDNYNVTDHFTVSGDLYRKQGAGYPVDIIVINGRGKSALRLPAADVPRIYDSFDSLKEVLSEQGNDRGRVGVGTDGARTNAETRGDRGGTGVQVDQQPVLGMPEQPTGQVDTRGTRSAEGTPVADRPTGQGGTAERLPGQVVAGRSNADIRQPDGQGETARTGDTGTTAKGDQAGQQQGTTTDRASDAGKLDKPADRTASRQPVEADVSKSQTQYEPESEAEKGNTLVPINMVSATRKALKALRKEVGSLDAFVAREIGYDPKTAPQPLFAEQIDALALGIRALQDEAGFIIGDQTGIGKGQVVAGFIRYAMLQGKIPVFVTEKASLYKDMYRDLINNGVPADEIRPMMTNADEILPLRDDRSVILRTPNAPTHNALLNRIAASGDMGEHNIVFTTYSQMQQLSGARTPRMNFLEAVAPNAILIFDESHNAGGTEQTGRVDDDTMNRAKFARQIIGQAAGAVYSSATYAKRAGVMDLYAKTDMRLAVTDEGSLAEAVTRGGVPMQQAVAAMLVESGQYIRRERSFDGINYNTPVVPVNRHTAENVSGVMRAIRDFDKAKQAAMAEMQDEIRAAGEAMGADTSTGEAGVKSTNFTSLMHNLVNQMLLGLKADAAADLAIESLRKGNKPILTVANTNGSFLKDYVTDNDLKPGDAVGLSFGNMLRRYLERSREVRIGKPFEKNPEIRYLTDEQLGEAGLRTYNHTLKLIQETDWSQIAVSPIDHIKHRLQAAGYRIGEITGRDGFIDYADGGAVYRKRPGRELTPAGKNETVAAFNSGDLDAVLINQSGSTGLSMHASKTFADQRKRDMIVVQAENNIDTHMQLLGRPNRTGQVVLPEYFQMVADIPAEKRPAAVLAKKMASLNANTTANRGSAVTSKETVDFMNQYGDEIAAQLMNDLPEIHDQLDRPLSASDSGEGYEVDGAMRKVTGRIPLLTIAEQENIYDIIETEYKELIARLDATGENELEAKTLPLDARGVSRTTVFEGKGNRPFERSAQAEVMDVKILGRPYSSAELADLLNAHFETQGKSADELISLGRQERNALRKDIGSRANEYITGVVDEIEDADRARAKRTVLEAQAQRLWVNLNALPVGQTVKLTSANGDYYGVVIKVEQKGRPKNPAALGSWRVTFAVADSARKITLPVSQINGQGSRQVTVEAADTAPGGIPILEYFDKSASKSREQRTIITGNLLAGFGRFKAGKIINFSDDQGEVRQGIMMPRDWSVEKALDDEPVTLADNAQVLRFLDGGDGLVRTKDKVMNITSKGAGYRFSVPAAKSRGGRYFLDKSLIAAAGQDFVKSGNSMVVDVNRTQAQAMLTALTNRGAGLITDTFKDRAREITGTQKPQAVAVTEDVPFAQAEGGEAPKPKRQPAPFASGAPTNDPQAGYITISAPNLESVRANWDRFQNAFVRNLSHLRRVDEKGYAAALKAAGSRGQALVALRAAAFQIDEALRDSGISWADMRAAMVESRLRGIRERYENYAGDVLSATDNELIEQLGDHWLYVIGKIQGKAGLDDDLAQRAVALVQAGDHDGLRIHLSQVFTDAARATGISMDAADFDRITTNARFADGLRLYKDLIEAPVAEAHAANEGVFSDALGPLDTYFPLVAVQDDGSVLHRIFGGTRYPYRKPGNAANYFATGLAEHGYSTEAADFTDRIAGAFRTNNKAALLATLEAQGLVRALRRNERDPGFITINGEDVPASAEDAGIDLLIVRGGKSVRVPNARVLVPNWLRGELKRILDKNEPLEPGMAGGLLNTIVQASLIGPMDLVFHSTNVVGTLVSGTPFIFKNAAGMTIGNTPLTKMLTGIARIAMTDPLNEAGMRDLTEMAKLGLVPTRYGSVASAYTKLGRRYADLTGAERSYSTAPLLYGPKGLDIRARIVMYRIAKEINPNATPKQLFDFVTQLGIYNGQLESAVEYWAKRTRIAPFATAGVTMLRNGVNAWTGAGPLPASSVGKQVAYRVAAQLSGGALGMLAMWIAAYKGYRGKYPWEDEEARLLQIPLNANHRNSAWGKRLYGPDPTKTAHVNLAFFSPLVSRGSRALGLAGAFEVGQLGGSGGQMMEAAERDVLNSISHPFTSGPLVRAPFVFATGHEPTLTGMRDITGQFSPQFYPAIRKAPQGLPTLGRRSLEAVANINPFFQDIAGAAGVGKEGEVKAGESPDAATRIWSRVIKGVISTALPRLIGTASDTLAKKQRLEKERKAAGSEATPNVALPDDVRLTLRESDLIPSKPQRKPDETDTAYTARVTGANEETAARVRALAGSEAFKAADKAQRAEMMKRVIEDSRHDRGTAPEGETEQEKLLLTTRSVIEDQARAILTTLKEYQELSEEQKQAARAELGRLFSRYGVDKATTKQLDSEGRDARARGTLNDLKGTMTPEFLDARVRLIVVRAKRAA